MDAKTVEKGQHQNIGRAAAVLSALAHAPETGLRFADVVDATGLGKGAAHRVLAGLVAYGLAEKDEATGRFFLGIELVSWTAAAANRFGLAERAAPELLRLCQSTEDTVYLLLRIGDEAVCIDRFEGAYPIKTLTMHVGDRRPLGVGSGPLALIAFLDDAERERILAAQPGAGVPFRVDDDKRRAMIDASRRVRYGLNDNQMMPGMSGVGVPIRRVDGLPIAAVTVACISARLESPRREEVVADLTKVARKLEDCLRPLLTRSCLAQAARKITQP